MSRGYGQAQRWLLDRLAKDNDLPSTERWRPLDELAEEWRPGAGRAAHESLRRAAKRLAAEGEIEVNHHLLHRGRGPFGWRFRAYAEEPTAHYEGFYGPRKFDMDGQPGWEKKRTRGGEYAWFEWAQKKSHVWVLCARLVLDWETGTKERAEYLRALIARWEAASPAVQRFFGPPTAERAELAALDAKLSKC